MTLTNTGMRAAVLNDLDADQPGRVQYVPMEERRP